MANAKASPNLQALPTSPSPAQTLPSDAVLDALKMILLGAPLNEVLTTITRLIEAHSTGMLCSISLLDEDGLHLRYGVAANLPEAYRAATDGICIGPSVGSRGTAAYLRQPVFVSAFETPTWRAILPEVVPKDDLAAASALNGIEFNLARAVGPASYCRLVLRQAYNFDCCDPAAFQARINLKALVVHIRSPQNPPHGIFPASPSARSDRVL